MFVQMTRRHKRMKRRDDGSVRYCTFSCYQRLPLLGTTSLRDACVEAIAHAQARFGFHVIAWVVMPEHVHLMVQPVPTDSPLAPALAWIKSVSARRIIRRWRQLDAGVLPRITPKRGDTRFWQRGGGYDRNIYSRDELVEKINYIHWNPVVRLLVPSPGCWSWSSFSAYQGVEHERIRTTRVD